MPVQVIKYRALNEQKGALVGFIGVRLDAIPSMEIHNIAHFDGEKGPGIGLPNQTYQKNDGSTGRDYYVFIEREDVRNAFTRQVLEALNKYLQENPDKAPGAGKSDPNRPVEDDDIPF